MDLWRAKRNTAALEGRCKWYAIPKQSIEQVPSLRCNNVGHDWPSKTINFDMLAAGMGPQPIEANDIVTEFFDQFSLSG